jgi:hypothetical protein
MPSVWLNKCEWYPVYEPYAQGYEDCAQTEIPQELLDRWKACKAEYATLQRAFSVLYEGLPVDEQETMLPADDY